MNIMNTIPKASVSTGDSLDALDSQVQLAIAVDAGDRREQKYSP
jgi:hypothetical protein